MYCIQIPLLTIRNFDHWYIRIKVFFKGYGVWESVERSYVSPHNEVVLSQDEESTLTRAKQKDQLALTFIHAALDEGILIKVAKATIAKQAWEILQKELKGGKENKGKEETSHGEFNKDNIEFVEKQFQVVKSKK